MTFPSTFRRERFALTAVFVVLGIGTGSLASRVPAIKGQLHLSTGSLGLALLGTAIGSVLSTPLSGLVLARLAPRRWIAVGLVPFTVVLPLATVATGRWTLLEVLVGWGFGMGCIDVAINTEATRVQTRLGRRILSGVHAAFSLGALVGAGIGALSAAVSIGYGMQFAAVGAAVLVTGLAGAAVLPDTVATSRSPEGPARRPVTGIPSDPGRRTRLRPRADARIADGAGKGRLRRWPLVALALVAFCCVLCEGATNDWCAVYLHTSLGASPAAGALGYAVFAAAMIVGRLGGDRLATRWGPVRVVRVAALIGAAGLGAALVIGRPPAAVVGFGLLGVGLAVGFPLAISAASTLGTTGPAVALVTSCGYFGLLCGPPVIGGLATATSLPLALGIVVVLCGVVAALAGHLRGGDPTVTSGAALEAAPATGAVPAPG
jgi:predicted MFS family arabinose efflux permease